MNYSAAKRVAFMGLLFALAIAFSYLENLIPAIGGLPPGVKLGLSNIVTMFCLFFIGVPWAFTVVLLKAVFAMLLRGFTAAILSFFGGIISVFAMALLSGMKKKVVSVGFTSIIGAVMHNVGQVVVARFILNTNIVFFYLPVLVISGVVMGLITGIIYNAINPYLKKIDGLFFEHRKKDEERKYGD